MLAHVPLDFEKIRQLREERGWTLQHAASAAGLKSRQHWHNIETGRHVDIPISTLQRIARALCVDAADLLTPLDGDEWKCG